MACDVIVVGAGPTGLMAALLLKRSGVAVRILDKNASAVKESRAHAVHARTLELFQSLGLVDRALEHGVLATGIAVYVGGKRAASFSIDDMGRSDTPFPTVMMLPQSDTEAMLVAALEEAGVTVERGTEVTAIRQSAAGVTVETGAEAIDCAYAIGADGAHSVVRKQLGLSFEGAAYPQAFLLADCEVEWDIEPGPFCLFMHGASFALFLPLKGSRRGRVIALDTATTADPSLRQGSSPATLDEVEAAFRLATRRDVRLRDARWVSRYRVHHRGVNAYRVGWVFVGGDAAHIHSPAGGQGMNTGLQDMANLAWKLAAVLKAGAPDALLESYDAERRPVGETVLAFTDRAFSAATVQGGILSTLRDGIVPILGATAGRSDFVRRRMFGFVSELGIRYEGGEALLPDGAPKDLAHGPAPGRRAPDARINRTTAIFDLVGGYRFHLIAFARSPLGAEEIETLSRDLAALGAPALATHIVAHSFVGPDPRIVQPETGAAFTAYGVADDARALYLIRPDGHVAGRWSGLDLAPVRAALDRFGLVTA